MAAKRKQGVKVRSPEEKESRVKAKNPKSATSSCSRKPISQGPRIKLFGLRKARGVKLALSGRTNSGIGGMVSSGKLNACFEGEALLW